MRTTFWVSAISAALLAGGACKHKSDSEKDMDKAASSAQKAQEDVSKQSKEVRDEQKDVVKAENDVNKQETDVAKQQRDLNQAQTDLAQSRDRFVAAAKDRLAQLDQKINDLAARTDAKAKDVLAAAKIKRDEIATKIQNAKTVSLNPPTATDRDVTGRPNTANTADTATSWDGYKKDLDDAFDKVEKDVNDVIK